MVHLVEEVSSAALFTWMRPSTLWGSRAGRGWFYDTVRRCLYNAFLEHVDKALAEVPDFFEFPVLVHVFIEFVHWAFLMFAIAPGLHGGRGEMAMAEPPRCFSCGAVHQTMSPWSWYSDSPLSSRPQPFESGGDATPCDDTREDFGLSL